MRHVRRGFNPDEDHPSSTNTTTIPRCHGGTDRLDNLRLVHRWCHHAHHVRVGYRAAEA